MKKSLILIQLLLYFLAASAQKIINSPNCATVNTGGLVIDKIILTDTTTQLFFSANYPDGFRISSDSYIVANGQKIPAKRITGIAYNQYYQTKKEKQLFSITFPAIKPTTKIIDYLESDCEECFKILDISLSAPKPKLLPDNLYTNWFKTTGGKEWVLSLTEKRAIYNGEVWQYQPIKSGKVIKLILTKGKSKRNITLLPDEKTSLQLIDGGKPSTLLTSIRGEYKYPVSHEPAFTSPVIKVDSAVLNGFINGYSPKLGYRTGKVVENNVVTGNQVTYTITIANDGSFSIKVPMVNPEACFLEFPNYFETVFLEPRKTLFQFLDLKNGGSSSLYFGDNARLNEELNAKNFISSFGWNQMEGAVAKNTLAQYSKLIDSLTAKSLAELEKYSADNNLSAKAKQIDRMQIVYTAAICRLEYNDHREGIYRAQHKIPDTVRGRAVKPIKYDKDYFSFLKDLPVNDDKSLIYHQFDSFINRFKFVDVIWGANNKYVVKRYLDALKQSPPVNDSERQVEQLITEALKEDDNDMIMDIFRKKSKALGEVYNSRQSIFEKMKSVDRTILRAEAIKSVTDINMKFSENLMAAQDQIGILAAMMEPIKPEQLATIKKELDDESIYNIIAAQNNQLKETIERNRIKKFVSNELPSSPADQIFNDIIKKYKGKVVYVDFWATWCAPCRANIEEVAPLKEELKNQDIAFVYITGTTSPLETYKSMAPAIKGEHFRVTNDQWNYLLGKFGISGIPHHILVNKKGEVVNPDFHTGGNADLKNKLLATLKE